MHWIDLLKTPAILKDQLLEEFFKMLARYLFPPRKPYFLLENPPHGLTPSNLIIYSVNFYGSMPGLIPIDISLYLRYCDLADTYNT